MAKITIQRRFQSTPSVGRATKKKHEQQLYALISIHALRGEGDTVRASSIRTTEWISIHALRGEGDQIKCFICGASNIISIHALRGEGDRIIRKKSKST